MDYNIQKLLQDAKNNLKLGNMNEVQNCIAQILMEVNDDAQVYLEVGRLYIALGNYPVASVYVRKAFDIEKSFETLELLANVHFNAEKYDLAAIEFEELIKHFQKEEFYIKCMKAYEKCDFYEESIRIAKMYNYTYKNVESYAELLIRYIVAGMENDAMIISEEMKKLFPNNAITFNMLGLYEECINNDYELAKEYFKKSTNSGNINAYYNLGVCCKQSEDLENAEKYLNKLKSISEELDKNYNYTLGTTYFSERKLRMGYKYYLKRKNVQKYKEIYKDSLWDGKDYPEEILYISVEQGFGNTIQFLRYVPMAAQKFKKVYLCVYDELYSLIKSNIETKKNPNIEIITQEQQVRSNKFAMLMDLPYLLHQNFHNIPAQKSYIKANDRKVEMFKTNFFEENNKIKIGLSWRAKGMGLRDAVYRTIDAPYYYKPIMNLENAEYYSFQFGDIFDMCKKYPQIKDLTKHIKDFSDTAAALANIDVLVTVDTALAHLAGAMGVKTYLLLCHAPDWRWFDNDKKTEWYPSVTIIKQHDRRTWEDVSEKLTEYIKKDAEKYAKNR